MGSTTLVYAIRRSSKSVTINADSTRTNASDGIIYSAKTQRALPIDSFKITR
jgi:hypothetical protein